MTLCQAVLVCGRFAVVLQVNKVAGNFHFAAGHSYQSGSMHIHDMAPFADKVLDFTHKVHSLSFGQPYPVRALQQFMAAGRGAHILITSSSSAQFRFAVSGWGCFFSVLQVLLQGLACYMPMC
jgi:hypothetical protein